MRIRIVSDGYGVSTHVMAVSDDGENEVPIRGVQAVEWELPHPRARAAAKLTVLADVDAVAELEQWRPARAVEDGMGLAPEPGVPLWAIAVALALGVLVAVVVVTAGL